LDTIASQVSSHAEGTSSQASGINSHAEGNSTSASGESSHTEGYFTSSNANYAHSEGYQSVASGLQSHAEGRGTLSQNDNQHSAGSYNIGTSPDTIHETGIGTDGVNRKNAFEIYTDGILTAPELTTTMITSGSNKVLITREYVDDIRGTFIDPLPGYGESGGVVVAEDINTIDGNMWSKTITANTTFTFTNTFNLTGFMLYLTDAGSYTITWPASVKWSGGTEPALTATGIDIISFHTMDSGTTWFGMTQTDFQ